MSSDWRSYATALFDEHGLQDWQFCVDHARMRCGSCNYSTKTITLSRHFIALNTPDEIRNTLLHEVAHALAGPGEGHGPRWRSIARQLGARPEASNSAAAMPTPKWQLNCTHCGAVVAQRHRKSLKLNRICCAHCGPQKGRLRWQEAAADAAEPA